MHTLILKLTAKSSPVNYYKFLSLCKNTNKNYARISQPLSQYFGWLERRLDRAKISLAGHHARPLSVKYFENCMVKICREKSLVNCFAFMISSLSWLGRSFKIFWGVGGGGMGVFKKDFLVERNVFEKLYWSF